MTKTIPRLNAFLIIILFSVVSCKMSSDPSTGTLGEYLAFTIDGQAFTGRAVKPSTSDVYSAGSAGSPYLTLVYRYHKHTFHFTVRNSNKQSEASYTLDEQNGKNGYMLFVNGDGTGQWTNASAVSVTVASFTSNATEGTFAFMLTEQKGKVLPMANPI